MKEKPLLVLKQMEGLTDEITAFCDEAIEYQRDADIVWCESQIQQAKDEVIEDLMNALRDPAHPLHQKVLHHIEESMQQVAREIFEAIEGLSQVIDWEQDIGKMRELKEESWQSLKAKFIKPKK